MEALADVKAVRGSALSRGDSGLLLRAARESHEIVKTALVQLGITNLERYSRGRVWAATDWSARLAVRRPHAFRIEV
jgi:hypothetical protein